MNIELFNSNYTVRRFGQQRNVHGYLSSDYTDFVASLNIHPLSTDQMLALPEGQRSVKRLEGHGSVSLTVADETQNQRGDMVYYQGDWYECTNAQPWDHTLLSHTNYQFTKVPADGSGSTDLTPPESEDVQDGGVVE